MIYPVHYGATFVACLLAIRPLAAARWPHRSPRIGLLLWQALAVAGTLSAVGILMGTGLAPFHRGLVPGMVEFTRAYGAVPTWRAGVAAGGFVLACWLAVAVIGCLLDAATRRRRHREVLRLVARSGPGGILVIDHPAMVAYCVPGRRPAIVMSTGALRRLEPGQCAAVIAHERAHAIERHHLVLLPFTAACRAFPFSAALRRVHRSVELLLEMCADDRAAHVAGAAPVAAALHQFTAASHPPAGTFGAAGVGVPARTARLNMPRRGLSFLVQMLVLAIAVTAAATPASLLFFPLT